jgi:hypothetical protein
MDMARRESPRSLVFLITASKKVQTQLLLIPVGVFV